MRPMLFAAACLLAATAAQAQVAPADPIDSSTLAPHPFNAQTDIGDGVAQAAPAVNAGMGIGLGRVFEEADTNRDGVVTREEFLAKADRHFGMADTNKDGKITREEMQAQQSAIMQQMQKNLLGGSNNWQEKLNGFLGNGQPAPQRLAPVSPTIATPKPPAQPVVPKPIVIE